MSNNYNGIFFESWEVDKPKLLIFISHGMAEHIERYDYFAKKLNKEGFSVFGNHHIGHGKAIETGKQGHFDKGEFIKCVDNLATIIDLQKEKYPGVKCVLFGHSMGSFMAQEFAKRYGDKIDALILSGSNKTGLLHKMGSFLANISLVKKDKENHFLDSLSFGAFNKPFEYRTGFEWLSRDNEQVDKYIADPLCGFCCTTQFFREFLKGLSRLNKNVDKVRKDLPIYIMSGANDPVGDFGKGVTALYEMYKDNNIQDVRIKLYTDGRHEMLNEINKDEVISDIIAWIKEVTK